MGDLLPFPPRRRFLIAGGGEGVGFLCQGYFTTAGGESSAAAAAEAAVVASAVAVETSQEEEFIFSAPLLMICSAEPDLLRLVMVVMDVFSSPVSTLERGGLPLVRLPLRLPPSPPLPCAALVGDNTDGEVPSAANDDNGAGVGGDDRIVAVVVVVLWLVVVVVLGILESSGTTTSFGGGTSFTPSAMR